VDEFGASPTNNLVRSVTFDNNNAAIPGVVEGKVVDADTRAPLSEASLILGNGVVP